MNEEKIVKINGIKISDTGFKNLQFETSRYSDGLNTIRGFGDMLNEQNLTSIDTVSIDFVLNYYELRELAYVYCLFKSNGILPIENEYLLKKIRSTYEKGKNSEEIKKDVFIKKDISHLICFLQRLSVTSLEKTNNAYKVNMVLTLYNNVLTKKEYDEYINYYKNIWLPKTNFEEICYSAIDKEIDDLFKYTDINMKIYNIETLNASYKENIINSSVVNSKLYLDTEEMNEQKAQTQYEKSQVEILKNKKTLDISKLGTSISIPNHSILQIELITNNNLSNVPIKGSPIGLKSYLGIGSTHFSVKLIFNEWENDTVEKLKKISDKNIINHKIEIDHPLIQLFDFHTSNILNIVFNNLEEANGIMVNIVFALNGFRFSEETTINTDEMLDKIKYDNDYKQEEIGGLYLEYVADYLYRNRRTLSYSSTEPLINTILESIFMNQDGKSNEYFSNVFTSDYHFIDFLCSYSSYPTSFGTHHYQDNEIFSYKNIYRLISPEYEYLNNFFNKNIENMDFQVAVKDIFLFEENQDKEFKPYRALFNGSRYYSYVDSISAISLLGNKKYKNLILKFLYSSEFMNDRVHDYIMNDTIKKISIELFNKKQNGDENIYTNEIYKKLYEEFLYRLFYNLNVSNIDLIEEIKNICFLSSNEDYILFNRIFESISKTSDVLYESFIKTFYDGTFIERITREVIDDNLNPSQQLSIKDEINNKINEVKDNMRKFILEFENEYTTNKEIIINRAYNIFLTKINYFLIMRTLNKENGNKYEDTFSFSLDDPIRIFLLSSAIHSILLTRTSTRTDHFENHIVLGTKNIGYKISTYNSCLEKQKLFDSKKNLLNTRNVMFYETFNLSFFKKEGTKDNPFLYYKNRIDFDDFLYQEKNIFDNNPNKDINFFYGNKIEQLMLYRNLLDIATPDDFKTKYEDVNVFINENREFFIKNEHRNNKNSITKEPNRLYTNELNVNSINFPYMNLGFMPSHYTELFYGYESKYLNARMKQRIIGNIDPFKNIEEISNIVLENENYIMPDYDICIYKKEYSGDYKGEIFKTINKNIYMFLKNASSISIVKNPKTKIKTMTVIINNVSKSIFNFDISNGSFDMKSLSDGKIDIVHVEAGDEIRVRIGFDKKIQLFNGFINVIENTGNQLILHCSSFASLLYNEKISEMNMIAGSSVWREVKRVFKSIVQQMKTTLEKISSEQQEMIRSLHNVTNPLNDHLFKSFDGKEYYNNVFSDGETATMYTAFNLAIASLKTSTANKFIKSKLSDITQNKIAWETYIKKSLSSVLGSSALDYQSSGSTYDIYTNINNVDCDYENYGIYKYSNDGNPVSVNNFAYSDSNFTNKKESFVYSDSFSSPSKESIGVVKDPEGYGNIGLPVDKTTNIITSLFKERRKKKNGEYREHSGIDICCNGNSPDEIYAVCDGEITAASYSENAGYYVKIRHKVPNQDKFFVSAYMHLKFINPNIKIKQIVSKGTNIGVMGSTGSSSGKHLHFEMYIPDKKGNKYLLINPFDKNMLPYNKWEVAWDLVNVNADNGQYTDEWFEKYHKSKKMIAYVKSGGR